MCLKKVTIVAMASLACGAVFSDVTIDLTVGALLDENGVAISDGSLVQLIYLAEGSLSLEALNAGSFTASNEVVLHSFAMDSSLSGADIAGVYGNSLIFSDDERSAGVQLALRWWPTLTVSDSAPTEGDSYGQTNPLYIVDWVITGNGATMIFNYIDEALLPAGEVGVPSAEFMASYQVVPEPSTYALGGVVLLGALVAVRRRKRV